MKYIFGLIYALVLLTQLPHIYSAYASLEAEGFALAHLTAIGAAVAFELSTGVFTFRVVQGSKRRWTRIGLGFFIIGSAVANAYYYAWWPSLFDRVMPVFATLALPAALALFAEEFGAEVRAEARRDARKASKASTDATQAIAPAPQAAAAAPQVTAAPAYTCAECGAGFDVSQRLASHVRHAHRNGHDVPAEVRA